MKSTSVTIGSPSDVFVTVSAERPAVIDVRNTVDVVASFDLGCPTGHDCSVQSARVMGDTIWVAITEAEPGGAYGAVRSRVASVSRSTGEIDEGLTTSIGPHFRNLDGGFKDNIVNVVNSLIWQSSHGYRSTIASPNTRPARRARIRYSALMDQVTYSVRDNRAIWAGRSLSEWVPDLVDVIVTEFDPEKIVLFGSVADGTDGPDSDIDLLVVLGHAPLADRRRLMVELRRAARAIAAPHDLLVTSVNDFARNRNRPGSTEFEPGHRGSVVYERPAA